MAAIHSSAAERIPDGDYSIPHRAPPPIPTSASPPPQGGSASEAASVNTEHRRRGSLGLGSLLRRTASGASNSDNRNGNSNALGRSNNSDVPPVPSLPATRIAQAQFDHHRSPSSSRRKVSGEGLNMLRKSSRMRREEQERLEAERQARLNQPAPKLPSHNPLPGIDTFGGDIDSSSSPRQNFSRPGNAFAMNSNTNNSSSPAYAVRSAHGSSASPEEARGRPNGYGEYVPDSSHVSRTESMANRGRYSYASSTAAVNNVNSPRRVRRRKDPTPFNVLVIGAKNSGKTSFITFLRQALSHGSKHLSSEDDSNVNASKSSFTSHYLESDMDGERIGLTLWDSAGLEKHIIDLQLREMTTFVESKFEETFLEEQKITRSPGVKDTHIHCVFLVLDPVRLDATVAASQGNRGSGVSLTGLDEDLDVQVMRALWGKTTVIPVISKADTLTVGHMAYLKRAVWDSIKSAKLDPLQALELEDDLLEEEDEDDEDNGYGDIDDFVNSDDDSDLPLKTKKSHKRQSSLTTQSMKIGDDETPYIPMSILSPDPYDLPPYVSKAKVMSGKVGRRFAWGFADPFNAEHCDFTRLRDSIFSEWRSELRDLSKSKWYENWRTSRLRNVPSSKQRVKGGVTPVAAVPKEGRTFSGTAAATPSPTMNGSGNTYAVGGAAASVPRTVSGNGPSKAERMMGVEKSTNGSYRNVDTNH